MARLNLIRASQLIALACGAISAPAPAGGLQVAPVSVTIQDRSGVIRLLNETDRVMSAQVRVFRWHQENGDDELSETDEVVASPPFAQMGPMQKQIIRLVDLKSSSTSDTDCERSYRVVVDELPDATQQDDKIGIKYLLRYSVPVYFKSAACKHAEPLLAWSLVKTESGTSLRVSNSGRLHAQLADVTFVDANGQRTELAPGLLGYVLANSNRTFRLSNSPSAMPGNGQIKVLLNGTAFTQSVSFAAIHE